MKEIYDLYGENSDAVLDELKTRKEEKETENSKTDDKKSDGISEKFSKPIYVIFGAVALLTIAIIVVFIIIIAKRGNKK